MYSALSDIQSICKLFFSELILPKKPICWSKSSFILERALCLSTESARQDFNALHTTSTHISACTQTHTEGCLQYASKPPSWLPNAKCLPNKYRNKCINTRIMTCSHFPCIFHWNPPTFTHSLTINKPGIQVSDGALTQIHLTVYLLCFMGCNPLYTTYNILL